jgi:ElaB/YqjD/DUF883 family membrane-anchored ribosome-binding protein
MATNQAVKDVKDTVADVQDAAADALEQVTENFRAFVEERPIAAVVGFFALGYIWAKLRG